MRFCAALTLIFVLVQQGIAQDTYRGKTVAEWAALLEDRDETVQDSALQAMINFGSSATLALPKLISMLKRPFTPLAFHPDLRIDQATIGSVRQITLNGRIAEVIIAIGPTAAPAADAIVSWCLRTKLITPVLPQPSAIFGPDAAKVKAMIDAMSMVDLVESRCSKTIPVIGLPAINLLMAALESPSAETRFRALRRFESSGLNFTRLSDKASAMASTDASNDVREAASRLLKKLQ